MRYPNHKTKIVCTIGPASESSEIIDALLHAGMNIARLNFSHGHFEAHQRQIKLLREASQRTGIRLAILADLPGPKMRIGELKEEPIELIVGDIITLTTEDIIGDQNRVNVSFHELPRVVHQGDKLFLNDGLISLRVETIEGNEVLCEVRAGGELRSRKGLNLPGIDLGISAFTEHDRECLRFALEEGVDAVSQSFVASSEDILELRDAAKKLGKSPFVIAKIERSDALKNLEAILEVSDGIMVARGDLGVEIPIASMAVVQKQIMHKAAKYSKPVITATQMLESMTHHRRPTRAEATDVANAILDGTDAVMLSAESAMGAYPVEATAMLAEIAAETEPHRQKSTKMARIQEGAEVSEVIAHALQLAVHHLNPLAVVIPTRSGAMARQLARYRLPNWITAFSHAEISCQGLQFSYGVYPVKVDCDQQEWTPFIREWFHQRHLSNGLAILAEGPSEAFPCNNHRMEIVDLSLY